jgi:HAD superfamily hydrolase (TIGR01509 family)
MKGIMFDMDGVLIDAMPFHAEAFRIVFKEEFNYELDKKNIFLLEGMPGSELVKELFKREKITDKNIDDDLIKKINKRKEQVFKEMQKARSYDGVKELIDSLNCNNCVKAVVSGASKHEVESLLGQNGLNNFDAIITGEDLKDGKPDPDPFQRGLEKLNLEPSQAIIVENSPLGIESALRAGVRFIVTLNNTPLKLSDFKGLLPDDENKVNDIVFKDTRSAINFLNEWCCK